MKITNSGLVGLLLGAVMMAGIATEAAAQTEIRRTVLSNGGSVSTVGNYTLRMTIGQTAVLHSTVGSYELRSGFWTGPALIGTGLVPAIEIPLAFELHQNWPNPFRRATAIRYGVPAGGGTVHLRIYDVTGRHVRTLFDGDETPGFRMITWGGRDSAGMRVATGVYFCVLETPRGRHRMKMVLLH